MLSCCPGQIYLLVDSRGAGSMGRYARHCHTEPAISVCLWISGVRAGWGSMHDVMPTRPYLSVDFRGVGRMGRYARRCHTDPTLSVCGFYGCWEDGAVCTMFSCCPGYISLFVDFRGAGSMGRYARRYHAVPTISVCCRLAAAWAWVSLRASEFCINHSFIYSFIFFPHSLYAFISSFIHSAPFLIISSISLFLHSFIQLISSLIFLSVYFFIRSYIQLFSSFIL